MSYKHQIQNTMRVLAAAEGDKVGAGLAGHGTARSLLIGLRKQGFSLRVNDGKLLVSPVSKLTPEQSAALKLQRTELIVLIEWEAVDISHLPSDETLRGWFASSGPHTDPALAATEKDVCAMLEWLRDVTMPPGPLVVASWLVIEDLRKWQQAHLDILDRWLEALPPQPPVDAASWERYGRVLAIQVGRVRDCLEDRPC